jgi:hypothetical protein
MAEHNFLKQESEGNSGEARIEAYLNTLSGKLEGTLTEEQRQSYQAEMREHLDAMIEAHEELGASPEEAVNFALNQFGDTRRIAGAWDHVESPLRPVSLREALRTPFRWFGGMMLVWMAAFFILVRFWTTRPVGLIELALTLWLVGMPVLAGSGVGLTTRGRPILGTLLVMPPLHMALALFYYLIEPRWSNKIIQSVWPQLIS